MQFATLVACRLPANRKWHRRGPIARHNPIANLVRGVRIISLAGLGRPSVAGAQFNLQVALSGCILILSPLVALPLAAVVVVAVVMVVVVVAVAVAAAL